MTVISTPQPKIIPYPPAPRAYRPQLNGRPRPVANENHDSLFENDSFPHGWRRTTEIGPNGETVYRDIALTPEDFLNPQLGDQMPQAYEHNLILRDLHDKLEQHLSDRPDVVIFEDVKIKWGIPGLAEPFPDLAIVPNIKDKEQIKVSFECQQHGTRPCLIIEIMSPGYPGDDTKKVDIYERAGVDEYLVINPHVKKEHKPYELIGYCLQDGRYQKILPNAQGYLLSQTVGILFGLTGPNKREVALLDAQTGEAILRAEDARLQAVERAETESQARLEAEQRMQAESQARQAAVQQAAKLARRLQELEALLHNK